MTMRILKICIAISMLFFASGCEESLEVKIPAGVYDAEKVFQSKESTEAALRGIYQSMTTGGFSFKVNPFLAVIGGNFGLASDELIHAGPSQEQQLFLENNLNSLSSTVSGIWSSFYSYIYQSNRFIEGVKRSTALDEPTRNNLLGEAYFIRAISLFYLTNIYGDIPMPLTADYNQNSQLASSDQQSIYKQVVSDLQYAISAMTASAPEAGNRYRASQAAADALLARVYLYQKDWSLAAQHASAVIDNEAFVLETLRTVFTAASKEAIWQLANPGGNLYSIEAATMSGNYANYANGTYRLSPFLLDQFSVDDQRLALWTKLGTSGSGIGTRAPRKLWVTGNAEPGAVKEATTPLRLAELYLIRAEAYAQQNKLPQAIGDIDAIRARAGASDQADADFRLLSVAHPQASQAQVLAYVQQERLRELFSEQGHRWFDAKRSGVPLTTFFQGRKPDIAQTDQFLPIPENDLQTNNKLTQNEGY